MSELNEEVFFSIGNMSWNPYMPTMFSMKRRLFDSDEQHRLECPLGAIAMSSAGGKFYALDIALQQLNMNAQWQVEFMRLLSTAGQ